MKYFIVLLLVSLYFCTGESYKILAIFPIPAHSHYTLSSKLLNEVVKRGHEVTVVTPFLQKSPMKNLTEISIESMVGTMNEVKKHLFGLEKQTVLGGSHFILNMGCLLTEQILKHEKVQELLQTKTKYDLVILPQFLNEGLLGIAHHFQAPVVILSSMPLFPWGSFLLSHPMPSSYVPHLLSPYTGSMNFWQRLTNGFYDAYTILYHQWFILPKHRELVRKYIPGQPDLYEFVNNVSLVLINSHVSTYEALPLVPNAVEIGGLHIDEPKQLPEDLQTFLDDSTDGVVLFSMGSNLKSADLPKERRDDILRAFTKLKQNVIWKWESEELPGQPKNVKLMKWIPQSGILAHSNVKAFITHGGLLSTMESVYFGVPVIGIPIFADQKMNMATAASYGYGVTVPFQKLNEENLSWALNQVLYNSTYMDNVKRRSKIMKDRPMNPAEIAIYWIEYVVRHQGAKHLRYPGMELSWYQRNLLDVITFVLLVSLILIVLIYITFKQILKRRYVHDKNKKNK